MSLACVISKTGRIIALVPIVIFLYLQSEKELSKLMTRAMNEDLEGLVLKDINVM